MSRVPGGPARRRARSGFTLLEVAVTIVIVGIGLTLVLQVLNTAQISAAQTRNEKLARELGLLTLGRIASGLYREDLRDRFAGSYAEDDHPEFIFEVVLGDEVFEEQRARQAGQLPRYDSFDKSDDDEDDEEQTEQPYERVKVRVSFPTLADYQNYLILERWIPWKQVYGEDEEETSGNQQQQSGGTPSSGGSGP